MPEPSPALHFSLLHSHQSATPHPINTSHGRIDSAVIRSIHISFPGQDGHKVSDGHRHPLLHGVGCLLSLVDYNPNQGVIVSSFPLCLANPFRKLEHFSGSFVLALNDNSLAMQANARDVTSIFSATPGATFDTIVTKRRGKSISYRLLIGSTLLLILCHDAWFLLVSESAGYAPTKNFFVICHQVTLFLKILADVIWQRVEAFRI
jgi:hypothetical protein